jgi:ATP-binding cassette subfamily F protein 3
LLNPPNLLLMDEPTTHLDVGSIDALIGALKQYHGTLIFISHDVHFIRAIATSVLQVSANPVQSSGLATPESRDCGTKAGPPQAGGRLTPYPGDYDYYLEKSKAMSAQAALTAGHDVQDRQANGSKTLAARGPGLREQKAQRRSEAESRNAVSKARREKEKRVRELEMKIAALEGQQKELAAALEDPAAYQAGGRATAINRELSALIKELAQATGEWEKLTTAA